VLTGKYTRENHGKAEAGRGEWVEAALNDKAYTIVDELVKISKEINSSPSRVALAWLQQKPGVTSSIIGTRTLKQLDDNIAALDVILQPEQVKKLDELSKPELNFPAQFIQNAGPFGMGGTTINGVKNDANPLAPKSDKERYEVAAR